MIDSPTALRHRHLEADGSTLHVVEAGDPNGVPVLFLHGWPQSWRCWRSVMRAATAAGSPVRAIAIDLPGIGASTGAATDGSKAQLARTTRRLVTALELENLTLVGHDIGGMVVHSYLRAYPDTERAVIMDVVVPGIDPWDEVLRNPAIWHFALHALPDLPERLVGQRQAAYFDFFFDHLSADPRTITPEARAAYAAAYSTDAALTAGFDWYRTFPADARANAHAAETTTVTAPVLYLRGDREHGDIDSYVRGLRAAGIADLHRAVVPAAGHFTQEESPAHTWRLIAEFAGL